MSAPAPRPSSTRTSLLAFLLLPLGIFVLGSMATGGWYVAAVMADNHMSDHTVYCESSAEARAAGLYFDTVLVEPRTVRYGPYNVEFSDCTVAQNRTSHRPSWNARRVEEKQPNAYVSLRYRVRYTGKSRPEPFSGDAPLLECGQTPGGHYLNTGDFGQTQYLGFDVALAAWGNTQSLDTNLPFTLTITGHEKGAPDTLRIRAYPAEMHPQAPR